MTVFTITHRLWNMGYQRKVPINPAFALTEYKVPKHRVLRMIALSLTSRVDLKKTGPHTSAFALHSCNLHGYGPKIRHDQKAKDMAALSPISQRAIEITR